MSNNHESERRPGPDDLGSPPNCAHCLGPVPLKSGICRSCHEKYRVISLRTLHDSPGRFTGTPQVLLRYEMTLPGWAYGNARSL